MKSLLPLILIIVSVGLFFFQINPIRGEVSALRNESKEYDEALKMADELTEIRAGLSQTLESFSQEDLQRLDHFLPRNLDSVRIILDVDSIAAQSGIRLEDLKVLDTAPQIEDAEAVNPLFKTIDITFNFSATYEQGLQFMQNLQRSLRLLETVSLSVSPSSTDPAFLDYQMKMQSYWIDRK